MEPRLPQSISPYARLCFDAIAAKGLGRFLSIGGGFGLAHYMEYRDTHDIDAWWREPASEDTRARVIQTVVEALRSHGRVRTRSWGDVTSVKLEQASRLRAWYEKEFISGLPH
ncbi:MAG: hypothetical protein ABSF77_09985 [Spirochaetia bacterium]|jgi:hypothetical protein